LECCLKRARWPYDQLASSLVGCLGDRDGAVRGSHLARERKLAEHRVALKRAGWYLAAGGQQRARQREIKLASHAP
jgi:hypothetical protein